MSGRLLLGGGLRNREWALVGGRVRPGPAAGTPGSLGEMQNLQPHPGQSGLPPVSAGGPVSHSSMALSVSFTNFFIHVGCKEGKLYPPPSQCRMKLLLPCTFAAPLMGTRLRVGHSKGTPGAQSPNSCSTARRPPSLEKLPDLTWAGRPGEAGGGRGGVGSGSVELIPIQDGN